MKKNMFYISLIIIYLLFLSKDYFFKLFNNVSNSACFETENYYEEEYKKLSKMLDISPNNYEIIYSKAIFRDIYEFYDKITIAKGRDDNLDVGNAVINQDGLIGVINKINKNSSEVSLLTNKDINISVKINDSYGILSSHRGQIIIKNIKLGKEIKEGDKVYTSGLTNIPEGLLIGTVSKISKDDLELEYLVEVIPASNFHDLNYLGVVK